MGAFSRAQKILVWFAAFNAAVLIFCLLYFPQEVTGAGDPFDFEAYYWEHLATGDCWVADDVLRGVNKIYFNALGDDTVSEANRLKGCIKPGRLMGQPMWTPRELTTRDGEPKRPTRLDDLRRAYHLWSVLRELQPEGVGDRFGWRSLQEARLIAQCVFPFDAAYNLDDLFLRYKDGLLRHWTHQRHVPGDIRNIVAAATGDHSLVDLDYAERRRACAEKLYLLALEKQGPQLAFRYGSIAHRLIRLADFLDHPLAPYQIARMELFERSLLPVQEDFIGPDGCTVSGEKIQAFMRAASLEHVISRLQLKISRPSPAHPVEFSGYLGLALLFSKGDILPKSDAFEVYFLRKALSDSQGPSRFGLQGGNIALSDSIRDVHMYLRERINLFGDQISTSYDDPWFFSPTVCFKEPIKYYHCARTIHANISSEKYVEMSHINQRLILSLKFLEPNDSSTKNICGFYGDLIGPQMLNQDFLDYSFSNK